MKRIIIRLVTAFCVLHLLVNPPLTAMALARVISPGILPVDSRIGADALGTRSTQSPGFDPAFPTWPHERAEVLEPISADLQNEKTPAPDTGGLPDSRDSLLIAGGNVVNTLLWERLAKEAAAASGMQAFVTGSVRYMQTGDLTAIRDLELVVVGPRKKYADFWAEIKRRVEAYPGCAIILPPKNSEFGKIYLAGSGRTMKFPLDVRFSKDIEAVYTDWVATMGMTVNSPNRDVAQAFIQQEYYIGSDARFRKWIEHYWSIVDKPDSKPQHPQGSLFENENTGADRPKELQRMPDQLTSEMRVQFFQRLNEPLRPAVFSRPIGPPGFGYLSHFLSPDEETTLLQHLADVGYKHAIIGGNPSKRTVAQFGFDYVYGTGRARPSLPIPDFLLALREKAAAAAGVPPETFDQVLINRYTPGAKIGWHTDSPTFDDTILGVSVGAPAKLRLRKETAPIAKPFAVMLEPASLYILSGPARSQWEHSADPPQDLRYSITFRQTKKPESLPPAATLRQLPKPESPQRRRAA